MNGIPTLYVDQYGQTFIASTRRELAEKIGCSHVNKMYQDKKDGSTVHVGYIIAGHWLTAFRPFEQPA